MREIEINGNNRNSFKALYRKNSVRKIVPVFFSNRQPYSQVNLFLLEFNESHEISQICAGPDSIQKSKRYFPLSGLHFKHRLQRVHFFQEIRRIISNFMKNHPR